MFAAFAGARPQVRMNARISATGSAAIAAGVGARSNSAGVTRLTRASVVCADNNTAINKV
jgi:hypothetical protein